MATQITQIDLPESNMTRLRVEGEMLLDDAVLLEKLVKCLSEENTTKIVMDLADLDFLDSEAASILKKLEDSHQCEIQGIEIFLQSAVDMAERASTGT